MTSQNSTLEDLETKHAKLQKEIESARSPIQSFNLNDTIYTAIPNEERLYTANPKETMTVLQVMKKEFLHNKKSYYQKIIPPDEIYLLGDSSRRKILRAAQLNHRTPPITEETKQFTSFFHYFLYNLENRWEVSQQYSSCRFATNFEDDELATSLLLHYGWLSDSGILMCGSSIHKITIIDEGILINIEYNHYVQERFNAACGAVDVEINRRIMRQKALKQSELLGIGLRKFFYFKESYISIPNDYRSSIIDKLKLYISETINALSISKIEVPTIDEPYNMIADDEILLKWNDFQFVDGATEAQQQQRIDNNRHAVLITLRLKIGHLPNGATFKRAELLPFLNDYNLTSGKKYGFLTQPKHGQYIINLPNEDED